MPKWFWVLLAVVVSSGIYFSIRYGLRPKPIPLMKPNHFSTLEELGVVSSRRLFQQIRSEKVLVLGHDPRLSNSLEVWQGLIKGAVDSKVKIRKIYYLGIEELPAFYRTFQTEAVDLSRLGEIQKELIQSRRRGGLVVFLMPTNQASHLRKDSITKKLEASVLGPIFSLSQRKLILDQQELEEASSSCTDLDADDFESRLQCIEFKYAKSQSRKKLDGNKILGAIERYGLKEYLLLVHLPQNI